MIEFLVNVSKFWSLHFRTSSISINALWGRTNRLMSFESVMTLFLSRFMKKVQWTIKKEFWEFWRCMSSNSTISKSYFSTLRTFMWRVWTNWVWQWKESWIWFQNWIKKNMLNQIKISKIWSNPSNSSTSILNYSLI